MATEAQIAANRRNAQKSTGPRTPEGKAKVAQNALKHGLLAEHSVVRGEDPAAFEAFRAAMRAELAPVGALEEMLAGRIVGLAWRLRRAERFQNQAFDFMCLAETADPSWGLNRIQHTAEKEGVQDDMIAGKVIVRDFANGKTFERMLMYERRIEQSLYRAMAELEKLRRLRQSEPPADEPKRKPAEEPLCQTKPNGTSEVAARSSGGEEGRCVAGGNGETKPNIETARDHSGDSGEAGRGRMSPDGELSGAETPRCREEARALAGCLDG